MLNEPPERWRTLILLCSRVERRRRRGAVEAVSEPAKGRLPGHAAAEDEDPEGAGCAGIEQPTEGRTEGEPVLDAGARIRTDTLDELLGAGAEEELRPARAPEDVEAEAARRILDSGEVDMRGEVLAADVRVRIVDDAMAGVAEQGAGAAAGSIEVRGRIAVIDDEDASAAKVARDLGEPGL